MQHKPGFTNENEILHGSPRHVIKIVKNQQISQPLQKTNGSNEKNQENNETRSNIYPRIDIKFDSFVKSMTQIVWLDQPTKRKGRL